MAQHALHGVDVRAGHPADTRPHLDLVVEAGGLAVVHGAAAHDESRAVLAQQRTAGRRFTPEQVRWLEMIRDHIAASVEMTVDDLDYAPFAEEGGRGRAAQVFGTGLTALLDELNEVLAA